MKGNRSSNCWAAAGPITATASPRTTAASARPITSAPTSDHLDTATAIRSDPKNDGRPTPCAADPFQPKRSLGSYHGGPGGGKKPAGPDRRRVYRDAEVPARSR